MTTAMPDKERTKIHKPNRKPKRPAVEDSDDDDDYDDYAQTSASKPRGDVKPPTKRLKMEEDDYVDVVGDDLPGQLASSSGRKQSTALPKRKRIARRLVSSDDEDSGGDAGRAYEPEQDPGAGHDEEFVPSPPSKSIQKPGKGKPPKSGKPKKEESEIKMRDERKAVLSPAPAIKRSRSEEEPRQESPLTPDEATTTRDPSPESKLREVQPPLKKLKLPPIKKNRLPPATGSGPSTPATKPTAPVVAAPATVNTPSSLPRKPAATAGNADFDLRNANVYADLFKAVGGKAPGSGLNRGDNDEKRKELDRLREAARAERLSAPCFDLQAQHAKITAFEEKMKSRNSHACYPNILAGAFKSSR